LTLNGKLDIRGPIQEGTDLVQSLNLLVVHIKSPWVTIMNRNSLLSDSFHVGIKSFVQTHFILDKAYSRDIISVNPYRLNNLRTSS
ncbi:MAG: hypothetical protein KZQ66_19720, partial [Candidatus Thiodiazotropha sp. (ex Lucinoma aequizonata)]|nr:hypothetical protein [Candidatus Thiodiazotropha sp. (ex Lucinoma aequizonata)]MCU7903930.1 hypothetical protein [Candidatus Thiodiazotropha sp. (ex Lucinoma aequizonata)]